jgi:ribosomal protein S8
MITDNFKNKMLKSIKDNIGNFSFAVDGAYKERIPHSIDIEGKTIKISLILDSRDSGKITDIKLLDKDKQVLFETNAIYYKDNGLGVYVCFSISDIMEVN